MPKTYLNDLNYHKSKVLTAEWSPFHEQIFISGGDDCKVYIWDNSRAGEEQARHDYEDGPPEMVFPHDYHLSAIEDISWSPNDPFRVASVDLGLLMQVWKMSDEFID